MRGKLKAALLGAAVLVTAGLAAAPASADAVAVYVGYADSLRSSGFFPNPWTTAGNAVSQTNTAATEAGAQFDSGAIRIDNLTGAAITISNFQVKLPSGSTYNLWSSLVIPVGDIGIFAQTDPNNNAQFDTSQLRNFWRHSARSFGSERQWQRSDWRLLQSGSELGKLRSGLCCSGCHYQLLN